MAGDARVSNVDKFVTTQHSRVPAYLDPRDVSLPDDFTICIIGASQGIGEHIAYAYAYAGTKNILIASRTESDLRLVAEKIKEINAKVKTVIAVCDIASADSVGALANIVKQEFGRLDVVIPNAAYAPPITLKVHEGDPALVQRAFDVNAMGTYHVAHYFVPLLIASPGGAKIFLAVGSIAGCVRRGHIANTGYTVSKMAQIRLIEYLREQYASDGLLALAMHPGAVATSMAEGNTPESFLPYLTDSVGLAGATCVWLSSNRTELQWLNGRLISANWDMEELQKKKQQVLDDDLLKFALLTQ